MCPATTSPSPWCVPQLLIKWSGMDFDLATLEDADFIKHRFLAAPA
jgi:hypothetical protein